jgi:hypothetical protein
VALLGSASASSRSESVDGVEVRPLDLRDLGESEQLHRRVHGFERTAELEDALALLAGPGAIKDGGGDLALVSLAS